MPADESKPKHPPSMPSIDRPDDPTVRARRVMKRPDDGEAFLPDPSKPGAHVPETDAEAFGEEFVASATIGEPQHMDALDEVIADEEGGPFLELEAEREEEEEGEIPEAQSEAPITSGTEEAEPRPRKRPARRSLPR